MEVTYPNMDALVIHWIQWNEQQSKLVLVYLTVFQQCKLCYDVPWVFSPSSLLLPLCYGFDQGRSHSESRKFLMGSNLVIVFLLP